MTTCRSYAPWKSAFQANSRSPARFDPALASSSIQRLSSASARSIEHRISASIWRFPKRAFMTICLACDIWRRVSPGGQLSHQIFRNEQATPLKVPIRTADPLVDRLRIFTPLCHINRVEFNMNAPSHLSRSFPKWTESTSTDKRQQKQKTLKKSSEINTDWVIIPKILWKSLIPKGIIAYINDNLNRNMAVQLLRWRAS